MLPTDERPSLRLNKFLATQLSIGRRQADSYIEYGRVTVNGRKAGLGMRIDPANDAITVDGQLLTADEQVGYTYLLINKPTGYICSRKQQGETPTIFALLPKRYEHLKPVGRLDKDSSGLLLLTNDGDIAHRFMHPGFGKLKRYEVAIDKPLQPLHHQFINHGIQLADGPSRLQLERLRGNSDYEWLVSMHEGRNRQIRRTFAALGYTVIKLHRIQFGPLHIEAIDDKLYKEIDKPQV